MPRFRIVETLATGDVANWTPINFAPTSPNDPASAARAAAEQAITELLHCDHLVVLAGLGTSLCIENSSAKRLFPTMGGLWKKVSEAVGDAFFEQVQEAVGFAHGTNIEELLSRCQMRLGLQPPDPAQKSKVGDEKEKAAGPDIGGFVEAAEKVIRTECRQALPAEATQVHEDFLRRLVRRGSRRPRANLFTTNYDLCFETAAARIGLPVVDGFSFSVPSRFQPEVFDYDIVTTSSYSKEPDFVPRLLRLFKLHGSVDWHEQDGFITKNPHTDSPILIYPRMGKYAASYSPPFLEIMSRLQGLLRQRNVGVLAVCCGFNDLHVSEPILSAVKANASLRVVVCAPDLCTDDAQSLYGDPHAKGAAAANKALRQLDHLVGNGDPRISFINGFFPDLVRLMPILPSQTDAEQHEARIRRLEAEMAKLKTAPEFLS